MSSTTLKTLVQVLLNLEAVSWTAACQRTIPGALMASVTPPGLTIPSSAQDYGSGWVRACSGCGPSPGLLVDTDCAVWNDSATTVDVFDGGKLPSFYFLKGR